MELWGWLVGYVVLFALLHVLLYYVYARREGSDNAGAPSFADPNRARSHTSPGPDRYPRAPDEPDTEETHRATEIDGETVTCPHCGAQNAADQTYTYCWNCISMLRQ